MRFIRFSALISVAMLAGAFVTLAQPSESVQAIMAKVAQNQDRTQEMRSAFVYNQALLIRFQRGDGKICREELRNFSVAPTAKGTQKTLAQFRGKYLKNGKFIEYTEPGFQYKELDLDGDLITDLANDLTNHEGSRDGIATDLFPLTSKEQKKYLFVLKGKEKYQDKVVYRISFKPGRRDSREGTPWAGEILVDVQAYQPVVVTTRLAHPVPFWVKTLLGTNIKHLGFKVEYKKFDEDLWFPVHYGGEFKVVGVFFYRRTMAITLHNSDFQRAEVTTSLTFEKPFATDSVPPNPKSPPVSEPTP